MKKTIIYNNSFYFFLIAGLAVSFFFLLYVYDKTAPDFPVVLRFNDLGYNFLTQRLKIWFLPLITLLFIGLNKILITIAEKQQDKRLISLLNFANLELILLLIVISLQIFILNL